MTFTQHIRQFFEDRPAISAKPIAEQMGMKSPIAFRPRDKNYEIPPKWWFPLVKILTQYGLEIERHRFITMTYPLGQVVASNLDSGEVLDLSPETFVAWFRETIEGQDTRPVPRAPTPAEIREAEQQVAAERANGVAVEEKEGL